MPCTADVVAQPFIGVQRLTGGFECSRFDWGLESRAHIAPAAHATAKYGSPFTTDTQPPSVWCFRNSCGIWQLQSLCAAVYV